MSAAQAEILWRAACILLGLVVFLLDPPLWNSLDQPASQMTLYIISLIFNLKNSFSDSSDISAHVHTLLQINTNTIKSVC